MAKKAKKQRTTVRALAGYTTAAKTSGVKRTAKKSAAAARKRTVKKTSGVAKKRPVLIHRNGKTEKAWLLG